MTNEDPQKIKARLNDIAADVRDVYQDAVCCIRDLQRQVEVLREERDRLEGFLKKAAVWRIEAEMARVQSDAPADQQEPERRGEVAQPENLRCGDIADVWAGDKIIFDASEVKTVTADNVWFRDQGYDGIPCTTRAGHEFRLISRPEPDRLTIADLHAAPPGSELVRDDREFPAFKQTDGSWLCQPLGKGKGASMEFILAAGWDTATLTHPAPAPVTAETIRNSEPGSTWEDRDGAVLEWDGAWMLYHNDGEGLGAVISAGQAEITYGPLTRSTAAPRGDYGKVEVSTEPRVTIDPAAYETMFSDQKFLARLHDEIRTAKVVSDD